MIVSPDPRFPRQPSDPRGRIGTTLPKNPLPTVAHNADAANAAPYYGDPMREKMLADRALGRYAPAYDAGGAAQTAALDYLAGRGAVTGAPVPAVDVAGQSVQAHTRIGRDRVAGDEAGWRAWWNATVPAGYARLHGLGAAMDALYHKKRAGTGGKKIGAGGGRAGAATPAAKRPTFDEWLLENYGTPPSAAIPTREGGGGRLTYR